MADGNLINVWNLAFKIDQILCSKDLIKLKRITSKLNINVDGSTKDTLLVKKVITEYYDAILNDEDRSEKEKQEKLIELVCLIAHDDDDEANGADKAQANQNRGALKGAVKGSAIAAEVGCIAVALTPFVLSALGIATGSLAIWMQFAVYGGIFVVSANLTFQMWYKNQLEKYPQDILDLAFQIDKILCNKDLHKLKSISSKLDIKLDASTRNNDNLVKKRITEHYEAIVYNHKTSAAERKEKLINLICLIADDDEVDGGGMLDNVKGIAIAAGVGCAAVMLIPVALSAAGFTAGGVAAGSVAASIQSAVYGGATGGVFSVLQSVGAAGLATSTKACIFGGSAGLAYQIWRTKLFGSDQQSIWDLAFQIDKFLCSKNLEKLKSISSNLNINLDANIEDNKFLVKKRITEQYYDEILYGDETEKEKKERLLKLIYLILHDDHRGESNV